MTGKQLRNSILQWAIQGKLVSQDPNDEPASVLLERIRAEKARLVKEKKIKRDKNETIIYRGEDNSYYEKTLATGTVRCIDDEIPFDIPQGWEWVRIQDIVQINPKNKADDKIIAGFIPMEKIEATYLSQFSYIERKWGEIKSGFTHFADGDVAVAKITPCFQNRKSMILQNLPNGIGAGTTELKVLRPYASTIVPQYLLFFLESAYFIEEATFKGTANQQRIISGYLETKLFPLPPVEEQFRITDKIMELMPICERFIKDQASLDKLNIEIWINLYKSTLQEAIQGLLVPQIESEGTADELLEEIRAEKKRLVKEGKLKASALKEGGRIFRDDDNKYYEQIGSKTINIDEQIPFDIPNSWCWIRLGYIIDFSSNSSVKVSNIEPDSWILDLEDIEKDSSRLLQRKRMSETGAKSDKHRFSTGNILYSKLRPYLNKVLIADMNGYCTSEILVFDFGKIYAEYALAYLRSPFFVEYAMSDAYGVKMPRLGSKQGNNALMPIPPLDEQHRIVNKIKQLDNHFI